MASVLGTKKVLRAFEKLERESRRKNNGDVIVGFNASYALAVHELVGMKLKGIPRDPRKRPGIKHQANPRPRKVNPKGKFWDPQGRGQAKFLESAFRDLRRQTAATIADAVKGGASLIQALLIAGLGIQREAQKRVPVDLGNLKGSAFTERE